MSDFNQRIIEAREQLAGAGLRTNLPVERIEQNTLRDRLLNAPLVRMLLEMTGIQQSHDFMRGLRELRSPVLRPQTGWGMADHLAGMAANFLETGLGAMDISGATPLAAKGLQAGGRGLAATYGDDITDIILRQQPRIYAGEKAAGKSAARDWFVGPDKLRRFEISDKGARLRIKFDEMPKGQVSTYRLSEILDHPELYSAYPELKTMRVEMARVPGLSKPQGHAAGSHVSISASNENDLMNILMHEIQHHIQSIERFAKGGSPSALGMADYMRLTGEVEARDVATRRMFSDLERSQVPPAITVHPDQITMGQTAGRPMSVAKQKRGAAKIQPGRGFRKYAERSLPPESVYKKGAVDASVGFEKISVSVQKNRFGDEVRTFEVPIQPSVLAIRPDGQTDIVIDSWEMARSINANPERIAGWDQIYQNAGRFSDYAKYRKQPAKAGKLIGLEVGSLTKGCQRSATSAERIRHGILPAETRIEACYSGDCWVNKTMASKFSRFENMEIRDLELADPGAIVNWFAGNAGKKRVAKLNSSPFVRMGYYGDDSHAIATGLAEKWLDESAKAGLKKPTVFISSGYAPVSDETYKSLAKHADRFELHFSNSGWFDKNEIMLRFGEFMAARKAGVPAKMRVITNKDEISGVKMVNESYLDDLIKKHDIKDNEILETPYHDDALPKGKDRSDPTGKYPFICCETGKCGTCGTQCMTKIKEGTLVGVGASVAATHMYTDIYNE